MKVVILAGGLGTRMREETEFRPKPMVEIGGKPVLWHIMKNFSQHGLCEFIVCTGYKGELIEEYFSEERWTQKSKELSKQYPNHGIPETQWSVTVVDTGLDTPTGARLGAIEQYVGKNRFICTYGDGLAPVDISNLLKTHDTFGAAATVTLARPTSRFGIAELEASGLVRTFREKPILNELVSIGFFVFEEKIFSLVNAKAVLEEEPLNYLARRKNLASFIHEGFWQPIDTYRELLKMQSLWEEGPPPWFSIAG